MNEEDIDIENWEEEDVEATGVVIKSSKENQLRVIRTNKDYDLDYLVKSVGDNIMLGPHYQRRSRWSVSQKSLLIESFLLNIPIPPIFLYEGEFHEYEVVDGRQRLEAIRDFFNDDFRLKGLVYFPELNKLKYSEIGQDNQRLLKRRSMSATILLAESKGFDELDLRMLLFDRLNTGGIKLNAQELRNAIFYGTFNDLLEELSANSTFRKIWGIPIPIEGSETFERLTKTLHNNPLYKAMIDCELVLRIFGLIEVNDGFVDGSMKQILDHTMKKYRSADETVLNPMKERFTNAVQFIDDTFGEDAIKNLKLDPPKKARNIYDSLMVAHGLISESDLKTPQIVKANLLKVLNDEDKYDQIITRGNTIENMKYRIDQAKLIYSAVM